MNFIYKIIYLLFSRLGGRLGFIMKYCVRCGRALNVGDQFCNGCGMQQPFVPPELLDNRTVAVQHPPMPTAPTYALVPVYGATSLPRHKKGVIPFLVWSLILVPFFNIIGTPFAVVAAMFCLAADADDGADSDIKLEKAAVLCIIATVVDVITLIFLSVSTFAITKSIRGY
jgi:hypothetical protein